MPEEFSIIQTCVHVWMCIEALSKVLYTWQTINKSLKKHFLLLVTSTPQEKKCKMTCYGWVDSKLIKKLQFDSQPGGSFSTGQNSLIYYRGTFTSQGKRGVSSRWTHSDIYNPPRSPLFDRLPKISTERSD